MYARTWKYSNVWLFNSLMQFNMPFKIIVSKTALMTKTGLTDIRIISILCDLCLGTPCSVEIFYDRKWYSLRIVLVWVNQIAFDETPDSFFIYDSDFWFDFLYRNVVYRKLCTEWIIAMQKVPCLMYLKVLCVHSKSKSAS